MVVSNERVFLALYRMVFSAAYKLHQCINAGIQYPRLQDGQDAYRMKINFRRPASECVGDALAIGHMVAARHDDHPLMQKSSRSNSLGCAQVLVGLS